MNQSLNYSVSKSVARTSLWIYLSLSEHILNQPGRMPFPDSKNRLIFFLSDHETLQDWGRPLRNGMPSSLTVFRFRNHDAVLFEIYIANLHCT